jgi:hypothetical protein
VRHDNLHLSIDAATRPWACSSGHWQPFGQIPPLGQLEEVVGSTSDGPLGAHFFEAAQQELAETAGLFDLSEQPRWARWNDLSNRSKPAQVAPLAHPPQRGYP